MLKGTSVSFRWFLLIYALFGLWMLPRMGVPLDELTQRHIGIVNNKFLAGRVQADALEKEGPFGPVFESVSYLLEQVIYTQPLRVKLLLRHGLLFLLFLSALYAFYRFAKIVFRVPNTAGIATLFLALYPPLFVHTNVNSKDTFFLILLCWMLYYFARFLFSKKIRYLFIFALISGLASTVRITGLVLVFVFITTLWMRKEIPVKSLIRYSLTGLIVTLLFFYLFFPWMWLHPVEGWWRLFVYTTNNPWPSPTICAGTLIYPGKAPWWYLPAWMGVTIPVVILLFSMTGMIRILRTTLLRNSALVWLVILLFFVPFLLVLVIRPTLYDGWRHFEFLIVPLCLLAGFGLELLLESKQSRLWSLAVSGYTALTFLLWQPWGFAYMNEVYALFVPPRTFAQDYWGLATRPALEKLLEDNPYAQKITVSSFTESPELNAKILPETQSQKFIFVHTNDSAEYEIQHRRDFYFPAVKGKEIFSFCPMKDTLLRVVRLK